MKKLLALIMTLMMLQAPVLALAEGFDDLDDLVIGGDLSTSVGVIGGADGPTSIFLTTDANDLAGKALAAGRRINTVLSIKELKGVETGDPTADAAIKDLLAALGVRMSQQGDEGELAVMLSGQDVLTLGAAVSGEDLYLSSNLLGGAVVVGAQEIEPLIGKFLDMFVLMEAITAQDAEELKELLAEAFAEMDITMGQSMDSTAELLQELENIDFSALEKVMTIVLENMEIVENPALPRVCDAASGGFTLSVSNDEFVEVLRACLDFVSDNPSLKELISASADFYTEEEIQQMWDFYKTTKLYESEEKFRARHQTFDAALAEAYEALDGATLLDGDFTFSLYLNEEDMPVYGTMKLPMYNGRQTEVLEIVYTRQTVAAGVAHVCNITVDGETATIDALATAENTVINLFAPDGTKAMDVIITNVGENKLSAAMNAYEGDAVIFNAGLEGECEFTDAKQYISGKLELTSYDGMPQGDTMVFNLVADYAVNGVDFSGATEFSFEYDGVGLALQVTSETAEAQESIMAGDVTRLATLNDAAFQNWFVDMVNNLSIVLANVLTALPESVLMLVLSSGMV